MSSPIKPPGSGPPKPPDEVGGAGGPEGTQRTQGPSGAFREALDSAQGAEGASPAEGAKLEGIQAVADDLRAGRIDPSQAVEQLVQRALESPAAQALPPVLKGELEAHLRRTIAEDPSLATLIQDLERS